MADNVQFQLLTASAEITAEMQFLQTKLKKMGWNITSKGIAECLEVLGQVKRTAENVIKSAVDFDLKDIGSIALTEDVKRGQAPSVEGPIVLQVQKVRNVSAPKVNEESSGAPRLLKIQLTDGHATCFALENTSIQQLSLSTPPGTKILLKGTIPLCSGFLMLEPRHVEKIGGKVEKLLVKWESSKNITQQRMRPRTSSEGPPLFVPFDVKASHHLKKSPNEKYPKKEQGPMTTERNTSSTSERDSKKTQQNPSHNKNAKDQRTGYDGWNKDKANRASRTTEKYDVRRSTAPPAQTAKYKKTAAEQKRSMTADERSQVKDSMGTPSGGKRTPGYSNDFSRQKDYNQGNLNHNNEFRKDRSTQRSAGQQKDARDENNGRRNNDRRGAVHHDYHDDEHSGSRPTQGTLWDFLENSLPTKANKPQSKRVDVSERKDNREGRSYPEALNRKGTLENEIATSKSTPGDMLFETAKHGNQPEVNAAKLNRKFEYYDGKKQHKTKKNENKPETRTFEPANVVKRDKLSTTTQCDNSSNQTERDRDTNFKSKDKPLNKTHEEVPREKQQQIHSGKPSSEGGTSRETSKKGGGGAPATAFESAKRGKQHRWTKGDQCMAHYSRDNQSTSHPYTVPVMQSGWMHRPRASFQPHLVQQPGPPYPRNPTFTGGPANQRSARPTQAFYRPPSRDSTK